MFRMDDVRIYRLAAQVSESIYSHYVQSSTPACSSGRHRRYLDGQHLESCEASLRTSSLCRLHLTTFPHIHTAPLSSFLPRLHGRRVILTSHRICFRLCSI
ncbi:hypothetical protein SCHPADRAFT_744885 [Schizopora paradoxa]|uniref:Uncharacterized protein n=1 Tax=Schizopora paradoxa TaxID=27342 RepID=A0A0H2QZG9_9AGAM|nr:hypothetical protein SCHPADRAFT_744885 [Schizopora paradoxa]